MEVGSIAHLTRFCVFSHFCLALSAAVCRKPHVRKENKTATKKKKRMSNDIWPFCAGLLERCFGRTIRLPVDVSYFMHSSAQAHTRTKNGISYVLHTGINGGSTTPLSSIKAFICLDKTASFLFICLLAQPFAAHFYISCAHQGDFNDLFINEPRTTTHTSSPPINVHCAFTYSSTHRARLLFLRLAP